MQVWCATHLEGCPYAEYRRYGGWHLMGTYHNLQTGQEGIKDHLKRICSLAEKDKVSKACASGQKMKHETLSYGNMSASIETIPSAGNGCCQLA
jgi:hypothetical protein